MGRPAAGSTYCRAGKWYVSFSIPRKAHFAVPHCTSEPEAEGRRQLMADVLQRLRAAGQGQLAQTVLQDVGEADAQKLPKVLLVVDGLVAGREKIVAAPMLDNPLPKDPTVQRFGQMWTSGELQKLFPSHLKDIDQHDNVARFQRYVYPLIGAVKMREFTLEHADLVLRQPKMPDGSRRHIALILHRLITLATYPGKYLDHNPLPKGWLPRANAERAKSFLYPSEEAAIMALTTAPLVLRLLIGFICREGCRQSEAGSLEWSNLDLNVGAINLDENKTDDPRAWSLDPGTAEALRRWKTIAPRSRWVFPAPALPGAHRDSDEPVAVGQLARQLRDLLGEAGIKRPSLFEHGKNRQRLRAHDLRATFITISLALDKSETWVADRTGHRSSVMINRYRRKARQADQLHLGGFASLHEVIPELASIPTKLVPSQPKQGTAKQPERSHANVIAVDFRKSK
jgi:integrase